MLFNLSYPKVGQFIHDKTGKESRWPAAATCNCSTP